MNVTNTTAVDVTNPIANITVNGTISMNATCGEDNETQCINETM